MIFKTLLFFLLVALPTTTATYDDVHLFDKVLNFERTYQLWLREWLACPLDYKIPINKINCKGIAQGKLNYKQWQKTRKTASKLFDLNA